MPSNVRGLEHAGYGMSLRTIGNTYLMTKSDYPMSDAEYCYARQYAQRKLDADVTTPFRTDEDKYVYLGRLIGEEAYLARVSIDFNQMSRQNQTDAEDIKREPGETVEPFKHFYSTAFVPQMQ